jgi:hypothetical protein
MRRLLAQVSWERPIIHESGLQGKGMSFNPTGALIETLYYVATRCGDDTVRGQAINLLEKNVIVEGLWESTSAARMAVAAVYRGVGKLEDLDY